MFGDMFLNSLCLANRRRILNTKIKILLANLSPTRCRPLAPVTERSTTCPRIIDDKYKQSGTRRPQNQQQNPNFNGQIPVITRRIPQTGRQIVGDISITFSSYFHSHTFGKWKQIFHTTWNFLGFSDHQSNVLQWTKTCPKKAENRQERCWSGLWHRKSCTFAHFYEPKIWQCILNMVPQRLFTEQTWFITLK